MATADNAINEALFALIKSKNRSEAATYAACKTLLVNRFSDPSSEELLFNRLSIFYQLYENVAKNTFINGIKEPYHSYLLYFDLDDIEVCIIKCRKYDNHEQQSAFLNFARQRENKPKPNVFNTVNAKNTNPFATNSNPKIIHPSNNLPSTSKNANPFYLQPTPAFA